MVLRVFQRVRALLQDLFAGNWKWGIYVQFKIGHNKELIPEFVLEIRDVSQVRLYIAHNADNSLGDPVSFFPVFDAKAVVDHFLKMPAVFGNVKWRAFSIVLEIKTFFQDCEEMRCY